MLYRLTKLILIALLVGMLVLMFTVTVGLTRENEALQSTVRIQYGLIRSQAELLERYSQAEGTVDNKFNMRDW